MSVASPARRTVYYKTVDDIRSDVDRLAAVPVRTVGRWSFAQILEHLAIVNDCMFDGFGFRAPWWARTLVAPLLKNSILSRPMKSGIRLPARAERLIPPGDVRLDEALAHLRRTLARFERETPLPDHPLLGKLASQEAVSLVLRHSELHLSFVIPESDGIPDERG